MRRRDPRSLMMDWPHMHGVFLGQVSHFGVEEERWRKHNPFVFGWPLMVSEGNHFMEGTVMRLAAFRTIFSKSLVLLHTRLDLQVDPRLNKVDADDEPSVMLDVPVLATINYPENSRLSGGAAFVKRFNDAMGMSFPANTPVDVLAAFVRDASVKGVPELRHELQFLADSAAKVPEMERTIRLAPDLQGHNRLIGRMAFDIVFLALLEDPEWESSIFSAYSHHASDMVRVACAKGAVVLLRPDLIEVLIAREPDSRTRRLMQLCLEDITAALAAGQPESPNPE
jgi:hypothetical protein